MANIGSIAEKLKVSASTLLRWERLGLIPEPPRRPSGWRDYGEEEIEAISEYIQKKQSG